jgi:septal ring factor EnvC (AmiA/AmiB activator)
VRRNQRKKAALASTKDACSRLQAENQALLQQLEESTQESYQVSEHFRQELLAKNQRIAELQRQHDQVRAWASRRGVCAALGSSGTRSAAWACSHMLVTGRKLTSAMPAQLRLLACRP